MADPEKVKGLPSTIQLRGRNVKVRWQRVNPYVLNEPLEDGTGAVKQVNLWMPVLPVGFSYEDMPYLRSYIYKEDVNTGEYSTISPEQAGNMGEFADDVLLERQTYLALANSLIDKCVSERDLRLADVERYLESSAMKIVAEGGIPNLDMLSKNIMRITEDPNYINTLLPQEPDMADWQKKSAEALARKAPEDTTPQRRVLFAGEVTPETKLTDKDVIIANSQEEASALGATNWLTPQEYYGEEKYNPLTGEAKDKLIEPGGGLEPYKLRPEDQQAQLLRERQTQGYVAPSDITQASRNYQLGQTNLGSQGGKGTAFGSQQAVNQQEIERRQKQANDEEWKKLLNQARQLNARPERMVRL